MKLCTPIFIADSPPQSYTDKDEVNKGSHIGHLNWNMRHEHWIMFNYMTFVDLIGQKAQNILFLVSKSKSSVRRSWFRYLQSKPLQKWTHGTNKFKNLNSLKGGCVWSVSLSGAEYLSPSVKPGLLLSLCWVKVPAGFTSLSNVFMVDKVKATRKQFLF